MDREWKWRLGMWEVKNVCECMVNCYGEEWSKENSLGRWLAKCSGQNLGTA